MSTDSSTEELKVVAFPLFDEVTALDFVGATQIFAEARILNSKEKFERIYKPIWVAPEMREYKTTEGDHLVYRPHYTFGQRERPKIDILFFPGGDPGEYDKQTKEGYGYIRAMLDDDDPNGYQQFIRKVAKEEAEWCGSVCTGAFAIAAAGLFDDCDVSTYWSAISALEEFKKKNYPICIPEGYPRAIINPDKKRFSGGGVSSGMDLALALIKQISGEKAAMIAQLRSQYSPDPVVHFGSPDEATGYALAQDLESLELYQKAKKASQKILFDCTVNAIKRLPDFGRPRS
ncbi:MAG: hypothetical protein QNJ55_29410 [Xenococcus sp. MO_188.B8]|nr:hypothetical protein [Xenococcus sp. MO_188.B8]